jgi:glycerol-1-phosphatase
MRVDIRYLHPAAHGMRTIDVLRKWCKISDPEVLASEVIRFETAILNAASHAAASGGVGIEVLPGVAKVRSGFGVARMFSRLILCLSFSYSCWMT